MLNFIKYKKFSKNICQNISVYEQIFSSKQHYKFYYSTTIPFHKAISINKENSSDEILNLLNQNYSENSTQLYSPNLDALSKHQLRNILYKLDYFQVDAVIKLLHYLPEETDKIIQEYLYKNSFENAMQIFKIHKNISLRTMKKLEEFFYKRFIYYRLGTYIKKEIPFYQLFEFVIFEDKFSISLCIEKLCRQNYLDECLVILNYFDFDSNIEIKPTYLNKILLQKKNNNLQKFLDLDKKNPFLYLKETDLFPFDDSFGPHNEECMKIDLPENKIKFLNSINDINDLNIFENSKVVGIDCEWKPSQNADSTISLMQIADSENVIIIDMLKLGSDILFIEKFCEVFKNKNFVGFAFFNDLNKMDEKFKTFFEKGKKKIIDLCSMSMIKNKSLNKLVNEVFNIPLCKKEQCSNWEIRPLRLKQIHYAALDAHVLIKLHSKL